MAGSIAPEPDEVVVTTFVVRVIATPETDMGEDDIGDLREVLSDAFEAYAQGVKYHPSVPPEGVRIAWTIEP